MAIPENLDPEPDSSVVERWTTRSGVRIRYLDNAPGDPIGLPILFSPGLSDFADEYLEMLAFFSPRRVLVVEVRGRGQSDAPPTGYSVTAHTRDLVAVLAEEGIDRFHSMSFSRGTSWALELALAQPDRVASMSIGDHKAFEARRRGGGRPWSRSRYLPPRPPLLPESSGGFHCPSVPWLVILRTEADRM
jgi:pimeloyl-ACP methyl ester carboxylesterase